MVGVSCPTALGWVLSHTGLRDHAMIGGFSTWAANLWPLCVDLYVCVATLAALVSCWHGRPTLFALVPGCPLLGNTVAGSMAAAGGHLAAAGQTSW